MGAKPGEWPRLVQEPLEVPPLCPCLHLCPAVCKQATVLAFSTRMHAFRLPVGPRSPSAMLSPCEAQHLPPCSVEWLPFLLPCLSARDCSPPMTHERTPDTSPPPSQTAGPSVHSSPGTLWRCHFRSTSAPVSARQTQHLHPLITQPASKVPFWKAALAPASESFWF